VVGHAVGDLGLRHGFAERAARGIPATARIGGDHPLYVGGRARRQGEGARPGLPHPRPGLAGFIILTLAAAGAVRGKAPAAASAARVLRKVSRRIYSLLGDSNLAIMRRLPVIRLSLLLGKLLNNPREQTPRNRH